MTAIVATLRPYQAVFKARFTLLLQYRAAAFAGFVTQCWWGGIKLMVLAAFFRSVRTTPMTFQQAVDYVWLGQAFLTLLPWSVRVLSRVINSCGPVMNKPGSSLTWTVATTAPVCRIFW